jgi:hypothetical protein
MDTSTWHFFNRELSYDEEEYWLSVLRKFNATFRFEDPTRKLLGFKVAHDDFIWMHVYLAEGFADNTKWEGPSI